MSIRQGDDIISGNGSGLPKQTGKAGKYLKTDGITVSWEDASTAQIWIGTKAEYDSLESYDDSIVYQIIDDYVDIKPINKNASRSIGELVYSTVPIIDAGLHLADGALLDGDGLYNEFYEYMVSVYNNGHTSIFTTENIWQISINTYGKCGKYVLDTTNHTIRLPKLSGFIEGTLNESEIGDLVEAGLPNITGGLSMPATYGSASASGAISVTNTGTTGSQNPVSKSGDLSITLNASRSSSIYGASTTVQPESIKTYIYVVLANSIENIIELNVINELNNKADINLANTTAITNCITNIPQDIKLELNNGTLTLKAGSKVYVPNGAGVFDEITIANDIIGTSTSNNGLVLYSQDNQNLIFRKFDEAFSGTSDPATNSTVYYQTAENIIRDRTSSGSIRKCALPIAAFTGNGTQITSIDQVFNGFGYIGSTVFALPGVKGLIPDGRNPDGSLKNRITNDFTTVKTVQVNTSSAKIAMYSGGGLGSQTKNFGLNKPENYNYDTGVLSNALEVARVIVDSNAKITAFTPKTAFHALDYNDNEYIAHQAMPSLRYINMTLGTSGAAYIAPADGYFTLRKVAGASNQYIRMFANATANSVISAAANNNLEVTAPISKGGTCNIYYTATGATEQFTFIYAKGAQ